MSGRKPNRSIAAPGKDHRASRWFVAAIIFIIVFAVFWPAMNNGFVDWDDRDNFLLNNEYRGLSAENLQWMFTTFHMGHYQPLTWLTHGLNAEIARQFYGDPLDPRPYHFTNNVLHALNAVLLFYIALRLIQAARTRLTTQPVEQKPANKKLSVKAGRSDGLGGESLLAASLAALFFGVHPLRVESVAWITERRDLLSGFFILLTVLAYLRMANLPQRSWFWMSVVVGCFLLSLISKVMGVTLPVVLLILDWYPLRRLPSSPRQWFVPQYRNVILEKAPLFALAIVFSLIASIGQQRNHWLAPWWLHPLDARIVQSFYGLMFYIWKTAWPAHLMPIYELVFPLNIRQWRFAAAIGAVVAGAILILLFRRRCPWLVAAALCYAVMLAPVLGIMQNGAQLVADRYSYLPCMAWAILLGAGVVQLAARKRSLIIPAAAAVFVCLGALAYGSVRQIAIWRDTETFWNYLVTIDPDNSIGQNSYGFVLLQKSQVDPAIERFRRSLSVRPGYEPAHRNLISALGQKGDVESLRNACEAAIKSGLQWQQPLLVATAHYRLGELNRVQGKVNDAVEEYRAALNANPAMVEAGTDLGFVLVQLGRREEAIAEYQRVLAMDPSYFSARFNLGVSLSRAGRRAEAIEQLQKALQIRPNHEGARAELDRLLGGPP